MSNNDWIAIFTAATAFFTGIMAVISWLLYRHNQIDTGRVKPVVIRGAREAGGVFRPNVDASWEHSPDEWERLRVFELYVFNRSNIKQTLTFKDLKVWGDKDFYLYHILEDVEVPAHGGGNFPIRVSNHKWLNLEPDELKELEEQTRGKRHFISLSSETVSGHKTTFRGFVRFELYRGKFL